jgi:hypothetical protein
MRLLLNVTFPHEPFNSLVREGRAGESIKRILDELKPEAAYFTETGGRRSAVLVVNAADPSKIPSLAEPWFLTFEADCEFSVAMVPEDLARAGLDDIGKKWGD